MTLMPQQPGWYDDGRGGRRYWDGRGWVDVAPPAALVPVAPQRSWQPPHSQPPVQHVMVHTPPKSQSTAYLLAIFLGIFGAHRYYLGRIGTAVAMSIIWLVSFLGTFVLIGWLGIAALWIWVIVDLFLIPGMVREENAKRGWMPPPLPYGFPQR